MEFQWELMVFTLFLSLGAGIFGVQGILALRNKDEGIQLPALVASLVSVVIGGVAAFLHLNHWERIFNGFGHLASGITQELIGVAVFMLALLVYFIMLRRSEGNRLSRWCGIMAVVISAALLVVMALSYNMASRPAWDTPLLWLYYLCNGAFLGCLGVTLISGIVQNRESRTDAASGGAKDSPTLVKASLISCLAQACTIMIYLIFFSVVTDSAATVGNYFDSTLPTKPMVDPGAVFSSMLAGEYAIVFWLGVIIAGIIVPLICLWMLRKGKVLSTTVGAGLSLVCALAGGMCFRVVLYALGFSVFMFY